MPYRIQRKGPKFCVVKADKSMKQMGCHSTKEAAEKQMRALYANEKMSAESVVAAPVEAPIASAPNSNPTEPTDPVEPEPRYAYVRFYFREGERTVDSRVVDPHAIVYDRPPPLPIMTQFERADGHQGAKLSGVVTKVMRDGLVHVADGLLDLGSEAGRETFRLTQPGPNGESPILQTWSPDLADVVMDVEENAEDEDGTHPHDMLEHVVKGTLVGFTIVPVPALSSAVFEVIDDMGNVLVPAPKREMDAPTVQADGDVAPESEPDEAVLPEATLIRAHAAAAHPPAALFEQVHFDQLERFVNVDEETGRVWGHAAGKGECHIGYLDRCVTIDMIADCRGEGSYEYAMPGQMLTAEGTLVNVGPIAIKGGHADKGLTASQAMAHYDDPSSTVAYVCYYNDEFGVSYSGVIAPMATPAMVATLRASGVSLDARQIDGDLRYLATCCVNTQGFPKVSARLVSSAEGEEAEILALVAAGGPPEPFCAPCLEAKAELDALDDRLMDALAASLD